MVECGSDHEQPRRDDGALIVDVAERYGPWAAIAGGSEGVGASVARRDAVEPMSQGATALHD
jgi:hypothetical protein